MEFVATNQLYFVRGFRRVRNFIIPPGYDFLAAQCEAFFADHPNYDRNVFLMTRFDPANRLLVQLDVELRRVLREHGGRQATCHPVQNPGHVDRAGAGKRGG